MSSETHPSHETKENPYQKSILYLSAIELFMMEQLGYSFLISSNIRNKKSIKLDEGCKYFPVQKVFNEKGKLLFDETNEFNIHQTSTHTKFQNYSKCSSSEKYEKTETLTNRQNDKRKVAKTQRDLIPRLKDFFNSIITNWLSNNKDKIENSNDVDKLKLDQTQTKKSESKSFTSTMLKMLPIKQFEKIKVVLRNFAMAGPGLMLYTVLKNFFGQNKTKQVLIYNENATQNIKESCTELQVYMDEKTTQKMPFYQFRNMIMTETNTIKIDTPKKTEERKIGGAFVPINVDDFKPKIIQKENTTLDDQNKMQFVTLLRNLSPHSLENIRKELNNILNEKNKTTVVSEPPPIIDLTKTMLDK
ncbi:hypothetical protein EIN_122450 [Entamoeba invadens IP1]|uniref:Uncharacterized protein n=1 Tax=Entamoeba invadens IP1 TaxID=370355 RepID=A0A0A1UG41_ENTIV|nr:hypothetical protein EIN_122450 [Entamoeba invadens IP1]ELP92324.1 hypothetical protein EIN_122450 [Entamoeba invadens IP1]|eukprot:XP_004259095.1 hypothetical protein EIN_122450 [Entamoeba invadens IP1]